MSKLAFLVGLSVLFAAPVRADDSVLPSRVAEALGEFTDRCRNAGGIPSTPVAVKRADLNGDGNEDYVLDASAISCSGGARDFDAPPDKPVLVFLGDGADGASPAFRQSAYAVKVEKQVAATRIWLTLSGEGCGKKKARFHDDESFCDRPLVWNEASKKVELAPVSEARTLR
jgi:hypothetical protein